MLLPDGSLLGPHGDDAHGGQGVVVDAVPHSQELKHSSAMDTLRQMERQRETERELGIERKKCRCAWGAGCRC